LPELRNGVPVAFLDVFCALGIRVAAFPFGSIVIGQPTPEAIVVIS